ncbi:aspartate dehydrogenase [Candidatus Woesearchaeota archaeon]|nr:aspartate dehydrogenase [Candidatus Woesearchaeota archaeon]
MAQTSNLTKIGIIGVGNIGSFLCNELNKSEKIVLFVFDKDGNAISKLEQKRIKVMIAWSLRELISNVDVIIEAAHPLVVGDLLTELNNQKQYQKKVMIMSIGGLIDCLKVYEYLKTKGVKIYLPSGAIGGIDLIEAAYDHINKITLQTTKSPKSLALGNIKQKQIIFEGNVEDAIKKYPQNINIAARIALAAKDQNKITVKIIVDPEIKTNQHEIFIEGDFGKAYFKIENIPSPNNPKTSYLACLSALQKIKELINK